jgi:hypothetical protein
MVMTTKRHSPHAPGWRISIDDGYVEYRYELPLSSANCIDGVHRRICRALRVRPQPGKIRDDRPRGRPAWQVYRPDGKPRGGTCEERGIAIAYAQQIGGAQWRRLYRLGWRVRRVWIVEGRQEGNVL